MMSLLLVAPAIVFSDVVVPRLCTKPLTMDHHRARCVRRIDQEEKFRTVDSDHLWEADERVLELLDEIDRRCTRERCR